MLKCCTLLLCLTLLNSVHTEVSAGEKLQPDRLRISCTEGLTKSPTVVRTLSKIYNRINIDIEIQGFPPKRSIMLANEGIVDAECSRIYNITDNYPNLIRVPTPIYIVRVGLYSLKTDKSFQNWPDLAGYKIGLLGGTFFAAGAKSTFNLIPANNPTHLFDLLIAERIDFALLTDVIGPDLLAKIPEYRDIKLLNPHFMEFYVYHYVHKKHQDLVIPIDRSIRALQKSGEISLHEE